MCERETKVHTQINKKPNPLSHVNTDMDAYWNLLIVVQIFNVTIYVNIICSNVPSASRKWKDIIFEHFHFY
jgi:hypothetical protein